MQRAEWRTKKGRWLRTTRLRNHRRSLEIDHELRTTPQGLARRRQAPAKLGAVAKRFGILRRLFEAFAVSRQRDIDRQIARFLAARSGPKLTDSLEREISQRLLTSDWSARSGPFSTRRFP